MNFFENQWVEVFRSGEQTDSSGNTRKWTASDLEKIVKNYNAKKHEAPVVVGHPKDNAPAFGWVAALKTDGRILFARFKQLIPEFIDAVKRGFYKKRSISLYPDFTLRHIGFLGAVPPAIKGLADIKFSENNSITIEFNGRQRAGSPGDRIKNSFSTQTRGSKLMTTRKTDRDSEVCRLKAQLKEEQKKNRLAGFKEFVSGLHSEGKIVSDLQDDIIELMEVMHEAGEFDFSEGKLHALEKFRDYLGKQPPLVHFGEVVREEIVRQSPAAEQINLLTREKSQKQGISYSEALSLVQQENPDLAEKAAQEI